MKIKRFYALLFIFILTCPAFAQNSNDINCKIWKPESFCQIPESVNIPCYIFGKDCTWNFKTCREIDKENDLTGIWITFVKSPDSTFVLEDKFQNISLVKKNGENKIHPKAILWYNRHETPVDNDNETVLEYMTSDFKAKEYKVTFKPGEKTDLILLFREAEEGDEIIIDDFLTSKIGN